MKLVHQHIKDDPSGRSADLKAAERQAALLQMIQKNSMDEVAFTAFISTLQGDAIENMVLADANSLFIQRALELEDVQSRRSGVSSNRTASNG